MDKIEQDIKRIFKENKLRYDYSVHVDGTIEVDVNWGDWKHDHLFLDHIMKNNGYCLKDEVVTEEDGSDCYSSTHLFEKSEL